MTKNIPITNLTFDANEPRAHPIKCTSWEWESTITDCFSGAVPHIPKCMFTLPNSPKLIKEKLLMH